MSVSVATTPRPSARMTRYRTREIVIATGLSPIMIGNGLQLLGRIRADMEGDQGPGFAVKRLRMTWLREQ